MNSMKNGFLSIRGSSSVKMGVQEKIREELSNMSFEELQKLRDELGTKVVNSNLFNKKTQQKRSKAEFKRENKNRPSEMSSKRPVRKDVSVRKPIKETVFRDPRFDDLSGTLNEKLFKKSYGFIYEMKSKEIKKLQSQLSRTTDEQKKKRIACLVQKMTDELKAKEQKDKREEMDTSWKNKQVEKIREGKQPYFLKNSAKKKQELIEKFEALKKSGKLEQYLAKKRKKNASKQKKRLPPTGYVE